MSNAYFRKVKSYIFYFYKCKTTFSLQTNAEPCPSQYIQYKLYFSHLNQIKLLRCKASQLYKKRVVFSLILE